MLTSEYDNDTRFNGDYQPVVGVTWVGAITYCHWLNELQAASGKEKIIFRLPIEEEWEWAASGGKRKYPWGNEEPDDKRANFREKVGHTTIVGVYPEGATPEYLMDMAGNVFEWMANSFNSANWFSTDEYTRALRGGSWNKFHEHLSCTARGHDYPEDSWNGYGFRVVAL